MPGWIPRRSNSVRGMKMPSATVEMSDASVPSPRPATMSPSAVRTAGFSLSGACNLTAGRVGVGWSGAVDVPASFGLAAFNGAGSCAVFSAGGSISNNWIPEAPGAEDGATLGAAGAAGVGVAAGGAGRCAFESDDGGRRLASNAQGGGSRPASRMAALVSLTASMGALAPGGWIAQVCRAASAATSTPASSSSSSKVCGDFGMPTNWSFSRRASTSSAAPGQTRKSPSGPNQTRLLSRLTAQAEWPAARRRSASTR